MRCTNLIAWVALAALCAGITPALAFDETKYPEWNGQWKLGIPAKWDPSKPPGRGQQAPLTPEYQTIFEAGLADQAAGGQGTDPTYLCYPAGLPRGMIGIMPLQFIVTTETTYIFGELFNFFRRIHTDGRTWPMTIKPTFPGYSIGHWEDSDGDGRY